jgi:hypothetical protein
MIQLKKFKAISIFIILSAFLIVNVLFAPYWDMQPVLAQDSWKTIALGIDFRVFNLPDPNIIYVSRMDRQNDNVTLESGLAWGNYLMAGKLFERSPIVMTIPWVIGEKNGAYAIKSSLLSTGIISIKKPGFPGEVRFSPVGTSSDLITLKAVVASYGN